MPRGVSKNGVNKGWFKKGQRPIHYAKIEGVCLKCEKIFLSKLSDNRKYCSKSCAASSRKVTEETRKRMSFARNGKKHTEESKYKISLSHTGSKHYRWNPNREEVRYDRRNDPEYMQWRKKVYERDNWICRIKNENCVGRIEAHHILAWRSHPELRYEINNGITLCHAHHPRKRAEEKKLVSFFHRLVPVLSV